MAQKNQSTRLGSSADAHVDRKRRNGSSSEKVKTRTPSRPPSTRCTQPRHLMNRPAPWNMRLMSSRPFMDCAIAPRVRAASLGTEMHCNVSFNAPFNMVCPWDTIRPTAVRDVRRGGGAATSCAATPRAGAESRNDAPYLRYAARRAPATN
jgi:hypothetical protein